MRRIGLSMMPALLCMALASCTPDLARMSGGVKVDGNTVTSELDIDAPVCLDTQTGEGFDYSRFIAENTPTKSSFGTDVDRVTNLALAIYDEGADGAPSVYYYDIAGGAKVVFTLPSMDHTYTIFSFANFFESRDKAVAELSAYTRTQMDGFSHSFQNKKSFDQWGFPMAKKMSGYSLDNPQKIGLKILVSRIALRIKDMPASVKMKNFRMKLQGSARKVMPFADSFTATSVADLFDADGDDNDCLSPEEVNTLISGGTVYMYLLENMQGDLMPSNTNVAHKAPDYIPELQKRQLISHYEINTDITVNSIIAYDGVKFRFALGKDNCTNFDVPRNHLLSCVLSFSDLIYSTGWYVDANDPTFLGNIYLDKNEAGVIGYVKDAVYITTTAPDGASFQYEIVPDAAQMSAAHLSYTQEDVTYMGKPAKKLLFSTTEPIVGTYPYGSDPDYKPVKITVQTKDKFNGQPFVKKELLVKVYYKAFPILFRVKESGGKSYLHAYAENPLHLNLGFETEINYAESSQQNYAVGSKIYDSNTGDTFYNNLHSKMHFYRCHNGSLTYDNTIDRAGKIIHGQKFSWNPKSALGSTLDGSLASGADGIRIDIKITALTETNGLSELENSLVTLGYPRMPADAVFWTRKYDKVCFAPAKVTLAPYNSDAIKTPATLPVTVPPSGFGWGANYKHAVTVSNYSGRPEYMLGKRTAYVYEWASDWGSCEAKFTIDPKADTGYNVMPPDSGKDIEAWGQFEMYGKVRNGNTDSGTALYSCPFVVINGGMTIKDVRTKSEPGHNNSNGEVGIYARMFEPGRDLHLYSYSGGVGPDLTPTSNMCRFQTLDENDFVEEWPGFGVWCGSQNGITTKAWDKWKGFHYGVFMTVNGCSTWPGATNSMAGTAMIAVP